MPVAARRHLARTDPALGRLIARIGPCRLKAQEGASPFRALAEAIVYQQLTGKAASTILGRVLALFRPKRFPSPEDVLAVPEETLRGAGLSGGKVRALKDLSRRTLDGTVPPIARLRRMLDEEIVERLTQVHGIGVWTVQMLLIFRLGRPDVLPAGDYAVRKAFAKAFRTRGLPTPAQVLRRGERWRPHRSSASWYLWRSQEASWP